MMNNMFRGGSVEESAAFSVANGANKSVVKISSSLFILIKKRVIVLDGKERNSISRIGMLKDLTVL